MKIIQSLRNGPSAEPRTKDDEGAEDFDARMDESIRSDEKLTQDLEEEIKRLEG